MSRDMGKHHDPEELVSISHAGGEHHINSVMSGKHKGYGLEHDPSKTGLQVHPLKHFPRGEIRDREEFYAARGSSGHGDIPAVLTGKIKAKHLQSQPNGFEAGIHSDNIKHIVDPKVERITGFGNKNPAHHNNTYNNYKKDLAAGTRSFSKSGFKPSPNVTNHPASTIPKTKMESW